MKHALFNISTVSIVLLFIFSCTPFGEENETIVDIEDIRSKQLPSPDLSIHQYKDVEIFRWNIVSESSYIFVIYRNENDSLKQYISHAFEIDNDFKKAAYIWNSDTVLMVRFFNKESEKELKFRLSGDLLNTTGSGTTRCEVLNFNDFNP